MSDAPSPRFGGEPITLGGTEFLVPPLGFDALKRLLPVIQRIGVTTDAELANPLAQFEDILELCHASLVRNYPALTKDELLALIDVRTLLPLVKAVMRQNALTAVTEKNAPAVASPSAGLSSTAGSPPPSAGPGSTSTNA